jgi:hypothetical protein
MPSCGVSDFFDDVRASLTQLPLGFAPSEATKSGFRKAADIAEGTIPGAGCGGAGTAATVGILGPGAAEAANAIRSFGEMPFDPAVDHGRPCCGHHREQGCLRPICGRPRRAAMRIKDDPTNEPFVPLFNALVDGGAAFGA